MVARAPVVVSWSSREAIGGTGGMQRGEKWGDHHMGELAETWNIRELFVYFHMILYDFMEKHEDDWG